MVIQTAVITTVAFETKCAAQDEGEAYRVRLMLSGYLLRSAMVCGGSFTKQTAEKAMRYASGGDLGRFSHAYPQTAEGWMKEGAGHFNEGVMKDGLQVAFAEARKTARQAP